MVYLRFNKLPTFLEGIVTKLKMQMLLATHSAEGSMQLVTSRSRYGQARQSAPSFERHSMTRIQFPLIAIIAALAALAERPVHGDDLADLQGRWELVQAQNGVELRVIKTIEDNIETVEVFSNGTLTQKHVVELTLETVGPVKVFKWKNGRIVAGPHAGKNLPDGQFIYRLEPKRWIAVHGMLQDDRTGFILEIYQRPSAT
jgi:hypothetical protein